MIHFSVLNLLLTTVVQRAGFPIQGRGDCEVLSDLILERTDEFVSYNTLRRMFGLAQPVKPRRQTLDVLAAFVGYRDYQEFCSSSPTVQYWRVKEVVFSLLEQGQVQHAFRIVGDLRDQEHRMDLVIQLCRELLLARREQEVLAFFQSRECEVLKWNYTFIGHFGNSIGLLFRQLGLHNPQFLTSSNFLTSVYLIHVDYSALNGYYGFWTDIVAKMKVNLELDVFSGCVQRLRSWLAGEVPVAATWMEEDLSGLHPILLSRVFSVEWLTGAPGDEGKGRRIWERIHGTESMASVPISQTHEIHMLAIMTGDAALMKFVVEDLAVQEQGLQHFEEYDLNLRILCKAMLAVLKGEEEEALKWVNRFQLEHIRYGYREVVELFWLRLQQEVRTPDEQRAFRMEQLRQRLDFPRYTSAWLSGYFPGPTQLN